MKTITIILCLFVTVGLSQNKYLTKNGSVHFEASVPSFEEVSAKNSNTTAILNTENGEFAALVFVKGFRFKNALMEEHFNENYAESDTYPKATFKGQFLNFNLEAVSKTKIDIPYSGELTFHGKTIRLHNEVLLVCYEEDKIVLSGNINLSISDFDIKIPKIVQKKLREDVIVHVLFELENKKR